MKILCFIESLGSGGAERQLCGLAAMLNSSEYNVKVITYVENQFYEPLLKDAGVEYDYCPRMRNKWLRAWHMAKLIKRDDADIVIAFLPMVSLAACLAKPLVRSKLIVGERNTSQQLNAKDKLLYTLYRLADAIVPNSYSQGRFLNAHFPRLSEKIHVITNFVDTDKFTPASAPVHNNGQLTIVTVGRYTRQKNIFNYLKAIKIVKERKLDIHFLWYGNKKCGGTVIDEACSMIKEYGIEDMVELRGQTTSVEDVYRVADIFLLPSLYEGFPNVICEAMSCGRPIVCGNVCDNPDIVTDGINGFLFDPHEPEEIAEKICTAAKLSLAEREAMGIRNRNKIVKMCSCENFLDSYVRLINDI